MKIRSAIAVLALILAGCGGAGTFEVVNAWARVPLPSQNDTVAYLTLVNHSPTARAIVSASSPDAGKVEMHEMQMHGAMTDKAMMSMVQVPAIVLPGGGKVVFSPTSYHLMIFGLKKRLEAGGILKITLQLDDGATVPFNAVVRAND